MSSSTVDAAEPWPGEGNLNADPLFRSGGIIDFESTEEIEVGGVLRAMPDFILEPPDYHLFPDEFFDALGRIEDSSARLFNDLEVMRWNADKRYLGELVARGLPVVATEYGRARS